MNSPHRNWIGPLHWRLLSKNSLLRSQRNVRLASCSGKVRAGRAGVRDGVGGFLFWTVLDSVAKGSVLGLQTFSKYLRVK